MFECKCHSCKGACSQKPGWFMPDQIEPLAKKMGLSVQELFDKHLGVDYWNGGDDDLPDDIFLLAPAIETMDTGSVYPSNPLGQCVFYKDSLCSIHTQGKPFECAELDHNEKELDPRHKSVALAWNKPEHQEMIVEFLGFEPVAENYFGGLFGGLFY